jgi:hypothetical protein
MVEASSSPSPVMGVPGPDPGSAPALRLRLRRHHRPWACDPACVRRGASLHRDRRPSKAGDDAGTTRECRSREDAQRRGRESTHTLRHGSPSRTACAGDDTVTVIPGPRSGTQGRVRAGRRKHNPVIPAKAGIHNRSRSRRRRNAPRPCRAVAFMDFQAFGLALRSGSRSRPSRNDSARAELMFSLCS